MLVSFQCKVSDSTLVAFLQQNSHSTPHSIKEYVRKVDKFPLKRSASTKKTSIQEERHHALIQFFLEHCNGTQLDNTLFYSYLLQVFKCSASSQDIGIKTFLRVEKELHIHKAKHKEFDLFYCPISPVKEDATPEEKKQYEKFLEFQQHRKRVKAQFDLYNNILEKLDNETLLIVQVH